ncbi:type 4a pilus biogenesis protein PilO [Rhodohalobacter halophilus]|uniref:type 4a pilus biogenesis protein PilO n=1 Tax=Rhodohalobacter halophilus TaxID=1812810 RepID=UPI00083F9836|nr:type 4a pilus biogenesis protein PilO [Rhodohalobacter halophilus]
MSYGLRNTLILLFALLVINGGGFAYMHFFQKAEIEELEQRKEGLERDYQQDVETAELVPMLREQFEEATSIIENFDKTIFSNNNADEIFRYLSLINEGANVNFNFTFRDSTSSEQYGVISSEINGAGPYRNVVRFINAIEYSEPVQKINNISISPSGEADGYQNVNFTFNLQSHYDRVNVFDNNNRTPDIAFRSNSSNHNPFFPLIRNIPPNEDGLPNVEQSRIVGLTSNAIYMMDQTGRMNTLRVNDRVYLGRLERINMQQGSASFRLNKGGIIEVVTLEVQR